MPRNQLESLLCMLSTGSTPNLVYRNDDDNITVLSIGHWFLHPASRMGTRGACANSNTNLNGSLSEEDIKVFRA
ncbi:hypothetical protein JHK85_043481 [Glycine max]|nr:hypothetical protein JHK85_043481 [Glycine max]